MKEENITYPYHIAGLIVSCLRGELTEAGRRELDLWLAAKPGRRELLARVEDEELCYEEIGKLLSHDPSRGWQGVKGKLAARKRKRMLWRLSGAASVLLVVGLLSVFFLYQKPSGKGYLPLVHAIEPGKNTARWITSSGAVYQLDTLKQLSLPAFKAENVNGELILTDAYREGDSTGLLLFNTVEVPRGGEYKLTLVDGTVVYLNAASSLQFPENFAADGERVVRLSGEAYFEVAKDTARPFVVEAGAQEVVVLGTSFNVSHYADDPDSRITLASGKVGVRLKGREVVLIPGEQAIIRDGEIEVKEVDVEVYTTWMQESFRFKNESIENIMRKLGRWYTVDVEYEEEELRNCHFSGYLPRYAEITNVLDLLSLTTYITFETKENSIIVKRKQR